MTRRYLWSQGSEHFSEAGTADLSTVPGLSGVHLDYIRRPDGVSNPSIQPEHVAACVARSWGSVWEHLDRLRALGLVTWQDGMVRTLRVMDELA